MSDLAILLVVILIFALLFRGPRTLPKLGGMFGRGVQQVRKEAAEITASKTEEPRPGA
ncbi:MAG: twin-arginine translocase TatA/TatE family subunit [Chloroflexi bacterium]|nr:twin-arginine translocase TatA/TatE family subunit [Chloroflexota bacterium]